MLLKPEPIYDAYKDIIKDGVKCKVIYMSPKGKLFNQEKAKELSKENHLIILCGHYEGVDERIIEEIVDEEISIGDYVLTGGELPAMVVVDSIARNIEGVLSEDSIIDESFSKGLLEYPQYTRPEEFMGRKVPEVLLSGNHAKVDEWRLERSLEITKERRPDLYEKYMKNHEWFRRGKLCFPVKWIFSQIINYLYKFEIGMRFKFSKIKNKYSLLK